jgi:hypothetical protein
VTTGGTTAGGASGNAGMAGAAGRPEGPCRTPQEEFPLVDAWAQEVLLGTEFGGSAHVVRRFTSPITVSFMQGMPTHKALLEDIVGSLAAYVEGIGMSLGMTTDTNRDAEMLVWFAAYDDFFDIAAAEGFEAYPGEWGQFYLTWDPSAALTKAYVLLASDLLMDESLMHFSWEEVTQALGPSSDSAVMPSSIFFQDGSDGGNAQEPDCYDRALLYLLYAHLAPGDGAPELSEAVSLHWDRRP